MKLKIREKLIFYVTAVSIATYVIIVGYILIRTQAKGIEDAENIVNQYALRNANDSKALLMHDMGIANAMATEVQQYFNVHDTIRAMVVENLLSGILEDNERYYSTWISLELKDIDPAWDRDHGRQRYTFFNDGSKTIDSLNLDKDDKESLYYKIKLSKKEEITNPYYLNEYSSEGGLHEEILGSSVCVPLIHSGEFAGIVGMDIALNIFDYITEIKPYERATTFLVANNGSVVAHEDKKLVGKSISEELLALDENLVEKIQNGQFFSFKGELDNEEVYITFAPIEFGASELPWAMGTIVYMDDITSEIDNIMIYSVVLSIAGLFILVILITVVSGKIIQPVILTSKLLRKLSKGEVNLDRTKLPANRNDELGEMSRSLIALVDSLDQKIQFASDIGNGKLDREIEKVGENDKLGLALETMRNNLEANTKENNRRNWFTQGVAAFSEVLRYNTAEATEEQDIYFTVIKKLVDYLKVNQGGIYLVVEEEDGEKYIELKGAYAFERKKYVESRITLGQGLVGQCVLEAETLYLKEVPEDYIKITSGLGGASPSAILVVPLKLNDQVLAVVELASFTKFEPHEIEFVEKVGESIAAFIFSYTITEKTQKLLKEAQINAEELKATEEEMKQNIEELEATQEAMKRLNVNGQRNEKILNSLMSGLDDAILVLDAELKIVGMNDLMKNNFSEQGLSLQVGDEFLEKVSNDRELWQDRYQEVFAGKKLEFNLNSPKDGGRSLLFKINPIFNEHGKAELCLVILRKVEIKQL